MCIVCIFCLQHTTVMCVAFAASMHRHPFAVLCSPVCTRGMQVGKACCLFGPGPCRSDLASIFVQLFEDDALAFACFERLMRSARRNFRHDETGIRWGLHLR